jgi:demethylmenaquinone methyltransferase / 2-methoxy-6-polyprenyl-1,4-benzoquinol methylase
MSATTTPEPSPGAPGRASLGASPAGVAGEEAASRWVRGMFGKIAGQYDLLNHLLSFNLDKRWRARMVERVSEVLVDKQAPAVCVLDLCCGTGDVLLAVEERARSGSRVKGSRAQILGSDFCHPMLVEAGRKITKANLRSPLFESDALALPLADGSLDVITIAFGFRNLANYGHGLDEFARVLKPGGRLAILEFSQPTNALFAAVYGFFSTRVLPWVGGIISGSREAYSYLPESIRKFPGAEDLASQIGAAGFAAVEFERMTFGAVALHIARR